MDLYFGLGGFKHVNPANEESVGYRNSWVVKYVFGNNLCDFKHIHRFSESKLLQDACKCANGENIELNHYSKEGHELCLCWANQAVNSLNQKWNAHYAKGKQLEVTGHRQSDFISHSNLKLMAYKSNRLFHSSEDVIVKPINNESKTLSNDAGNSVIVVDL